MSAQYLFKPIRIGDVTAKNRIHMAALTRSRAKDTYPTELMKEHYVQRAGAGLIVSEAILITRQGTEWPHAPGIWDDSHVAAWKTIVDAVHDAGTIIYAQLWHVGRVAHPEAEQQKLAGEPVYAPSAISARGGKFRAISGVPGYVTPTAIDNPWRIVEQYKQAAINAKKAGFDGVELHGANGYIIHQFLDNTSNHRTDEWGGSIENRARLGLEVLKVLVDIFGRNVAIKISPAGGYNDMGMSLPETLSTFTYFITKAEELCLSYIVLVRYTAAYDVVFDGIPRATQHDVLGIYGPLIKNAKVIVNAGVTMEEGEELVSSGKADAISIGFNYITHPDLTKRFEHGRPLDNVPDMAHLYPTSSITADWRAGYNDYPASC